MPLQITRRVITAYAGDEGETNATAGDGPEPVEPTASAADDGDGSADPSAAGGCQEIPLDVVFDMLKNERRRLVLEYVTEREGPFTLRELAEHVATIENDKPVEALRSDERKRVYVGLYQCHLPRMDDAGVVSFERNRGTVEVGPNAALVKAYLSDDEPERPWSTYYLGLAVLFGAATLVAQFGFGSGAVTSLLATAAFAGLALTHARSAGDT